MALTNAEKQKALRERRAELGQKEMRGIYVTDEEEAEVKRAVKGILKEMRKGKQKSPSD